MSQGAENIQPTRTDTGVVSKARIGEVLPW